MVTGALLARWVYIMVDPECYRFKSNNNNRHNSHRRNENIAVSYFLKKINKSTGRTQTNYLLTLCLGFVIVVLFSNYNFHA